MKINTVTVVGANGTMGANVSAIFASFGAAKVYMVCRDLERAKVAVEMACGSVRAESICKNLIPVDYSSLEGCIKSSDIVFESVSENLELKISTHTLIAQYLPKGAIACTGSSGLSITRLSECYRTEDRSRFFGVHMFNPPYQLPLCELTATKYSDRGIYEDLKVYLRDVLIRTVAPSKDLPAFLGNRIGFYFINQALQYSEKYRDNGGIDYIDAILGPFTGRVMPPIATANFVGIDVHKAIVDNIFASTNDYAHDSFVLPDFAKKLIEKGFLGKKRGGGFYKILKGENGYKRTLVWDVADGGYRDVIVYSFPFAIKMRDCLRVGDYDNAFLELINNKSQEADICLRFLLRYMVYSLYTAEHVGYDLRVVDDVMASGFTWCPPFAMMEAFSKVCDLGSLLKSRLHNDILSAVDIDHILGQRIKSKYDYRTYFRAK